jgi:hypothetical protein
MNAGNVKHIVILGVAALLAYFQLNRIHQAWETSKSGNALERNADEGNASRKLAMTRLALSRALSAAEFTVLDSKPLPPDVSSLQHEQSRALVVLGRLLAGGLDIDSARAEPRVDSFTPTVEVALLEATDCEAQFNEPADRAGTAPRHQLSSAGKPRPPRHSGGGVFGGLVRMFGTSGQVERPAAATRHGQGGGDGGAGAASSAAVVLVRLHASLLADAVLDSVRVAQLRQEAGTAEGATGGPQNQSASAAVTSTPVGATNADAVRHARRQWLEFCSRPSSSEAVDPGTSDNLPEAFARREPHGVDRQRAGEPDGFQRVLNRAATGGRRPHRNPFAGRHGPRRPHSGHDRQRAPGRPDKGSSWTDSLHETVAAPPPCGRVLAPEEATAWLRPVLHPALGHVLHVLQAQRVAVLTLDCDGLPKAAQESAAQRVEDAQPIDVGDRDAAVPAEQAPTEHVARSGFVAAASDLDGEIRTVQASNTPAAGTVAEPNAAASPPQFRREPDTDLAAPTATPQIGRRGETAAGEQDADVGTGPTEVDRSEL